MELQAIGRGAITIMTVPERNWKQRRSSFIDFLIGGCKPASPRSRTGGGDGIGEIATWEIQPAVEPEGATPALLG